MLPWLLTRSETLSTMSQPSSPVLKARRQSHRLYSKILSSILVFSFSIWLLRLLFLSDDVPQLEVDTLVHQPQPPPANGHGIAHPWVLHAGQPAALNKTLHTPLSYTADNAPSSGNTSLTAILPVTSQSVMDLRYHLGSFLGTSATLSDVVLLSPQPLHAHIRHALRTILSEDEEHEVTVSTTQWPDGLALGAALIQAAGRTGTNWVLLADEEGLEHFDMETRDILLLNTVPQISTPTGPRGVDFQLACLTPSSTPQRAAYLVPPLVLPRSLLPPIRNVELDEPWAALGDYASRAGSTLSGGRVIGSSNGSLEWCDRFVPNGQPSLESSNLVTQNVNATTPDETGAFLLVAHAPEAGYLVSLVCELARQGHYAILLVLEGLGHRFPTFESASYPQECRGAIHFTPTSSYPEDMHHELVSYMPVGLDVLISALPEDEPVSHLVNRLAQNATTKPLSTVFIPKEDLPYCDWLSVIDLEGWKSMYKLLPTPASRADVAQTGILPKSSCQSSQTTDPIPSIGFLHH